MAGKNIKFLILPRIAGPAYAERKGVQGGVRGGWPYYVPMRGTSKGARGGRFFFAVAAPTRARGRVWRFECVKEVLSGTKLEAKVLRRDKKWGLGGWEGALSAQRGGGFQCGREEL